MAEPTYDEMSKQLQFAVDRHMSGHTDGLDMFIVQTMFILHKLMADVQEMKDDSHYHKGGDVPLVYATFEQLEN